MRQLVYNVSCTRYQVPLYLWRMEPTLKSSSVSKFYVRDCLKFFLFPFTYLIMVQVSQNFYVLQIKKGLSEKHASTKVESFLMTFFDLNQIGRAVFTKNSFI